VCFWEVEQPTEERLQEMIVEKKQKNDAILIDREQAEENIRELMKQSPVFDRDREQKAMQEQNKKKLEEDIKKLEEQKKTITKNAIL